MANSSVLSVKNSCDLIVNSVRDSFLNFSLQETPFSIYLTIRKSFARPKTFPDSDPISTFSHNQKASDERKLLEEEIETFRMKLKAAEDSNSSLKIMYEEAVNDCEESYLRIKHLENKVDGYERKWRQSCILKSEEG